MEGLIEGYGESLGHTTVDGACRITGDGLRFLRAATRGEAGAPRFLTIDDIDSFVKARSVTTGQVVDLLGSDGLLRVPEKAVKDAICSIIGEPFEHKDWGGERSDVFTTRVIYQGRRIPTAMLLKGPAAGPVLFPSGLGRRGDQDLRLFTEPAELLIVQFNGKIDSAVHQRLRSEAAHRVAQGLVTVVCIIDGADTARLLRAYEFA